MTTARTQRTGISLRPTEEVNLADVIRLTRLAESLGYESVWVPEVWSEDAVSVLAVLAASTEKIRLASGVLNVYSRSPALIAQTAATLSQISGGRFVLGLGTSGPGVVERWHGVRYEQPLRRTRAYVEVIRMALAGERVNHDGSEVPLRGFRLGNPPPSRIPIYIAAIGPRNIRLTGAIADGWLPIFAARGRMAGVFEELRRGAHEGGRDVSELDVGAYIPALVAPRAEELLRLQVAYYVARMGTYYHGLVTRLGFGENADQIREESRTRGLRAGAAAVTDEMLEVMTVMSGGAGSLEPFRSDGIRLPILAFPNGAMPDEIESTLHALAPV